MLVKSENSLWYKNEESYFNQPLDMIPFMYNFDVVFTDC